MHRATPPWLAGSFAGLYVIARRNDWAEAVGLPCRALKPVATGQVQLHVQHLCAATPPSSALRYPCPLIDTIDTEVELRHILACVSVC